jgi:hypothetical protein
VGSEIEQERDDRWWLGLRGQVLVDVVTRESDATMTFSEGSVLKIGSLALIRASTRDGPAPLEVPDREDGTVLGAAALRSLLIGQRVVSAVGFKTGALRVVFGSGAWLTISFADRDVAWKVVAASGRQWVSLPGGGLAGFPAQPGESGEQGPP